MAERKMHQTTVRFGPDLWRELEREARQAGVSVAQYVRDAALMRVAYTRGRDGDPHYEAAMESAAADDGSKLGEARTRARDARSSQTSSERAAKAEDARAVQHARAQASQESRTSRGVSRASEEIAAPWTDGETGETSAGDQPS